MNIASTKIPMGSLTSKKHSSVVRESMQSSGETQGTSREEPQDSVTLRGVVKETLIYGAIMSTGFVTTSLLGDGVGTLVNAIGGAAAGAVRYKTKGADPLLGALTGAVVGLGTANLATTDISTGLKVAAAAGAVGTALAISVSKQK